MVFFEGNESWAIFRRISQVIGKRKTTFQMGWQGASARVEEWGIPLFQNRLGSTHAFADDVLKGERTEETGTEGTHREEQGQESLWAYLGTEHKGNFCFPGNKLFAQGRVPGYLHCWFRSPVHLPNDSSGKRAHFPENLCPSEGCSTDTTFQSSCVPTISLFSLLGLFTLLEAS